MVENPTATIRELLTVQEKRFGKLNPPQLRREPRKPEAGLIYTPVDLSSEVEPYQVRLRVLFFDGENLYASKGLKIYESADGGRSWNYCAALEMPFPYQHLSRTRLTERLGRTEVYKLHRYGNFLVALAKGGVYAGTIGAEKLELSFRVSEGSRPTSLACSPDGTVVFGEYFSNPQRREVKIYGSTDMASWSVLHEFSPGEIRHIHGLYYDKFAHCFWALTGDYQKEPGIARCAVDFSSVEFVRRGSQQVRAYSMICQEDGLYFATDTELERNGIYFMSRDGGELRELHSIESSSFHSGLFGNWMFFATVCEPSTVNDTRRVHLWASHDKQHWRKFACYEKDMFSKYFQYGNLFLLEGQTEGLKHVVFSGSAVKQIDGKSVFVTLPSDEGEN